MNNLRQNDDGFTHQIIFIVIIFTIISLLSFTGKRVLDTKARVNTAKVATSQNPASPAKATPESTTAPAVKPVTVARKGTAAALATSSLTGSKTAIPESVIVKSPYNIKTPEGSLNQLVKELKSGNFTNALYFISPRFMDKTAELMKSQDYVTLEQCKANETCKLLLNTPVKVLTAAAINLYTSSDFSTDGKSLNLNIALDGNTFVSHGTTSAGDYTVKVDMIDAGTNWVVDRITVNGFTI